MNKENREIIIKLEVKKKDQNSKLYVLERQETLAIEEYGKSLKKTINFKLDGKDHKIAMTFTPEKGLFGDKIFINSLSQGEFPEQESVEIVTGLGHKGARFKENPWKTEGKILVGFSTVGVVGLIAAFFWSRRKNKV